MTPDLHVRMCILLHYTDLVACIECMLTKFFNNIIIWRLYFACLIFFTNSCYIYIILQTLAAQYATPTMLSKLIVNTSKLAKFKTWKIKHYTVHVCHCYIVQYDIGLVSLLFQRSDEFHYSVFF